MTANNTHQPASNKQDLRLLMRLLPFITPYKKMILGAALALILTAEVLLALGQGIHLLMDRGFDSTDPSPRIQLASAIGGLIPNNT